MHCTESGSCSRRQCARTIVISRVIFTTYLHILQNVHILRKRYITIIYLFQSRTSENGKMKESATMTGMLPAWRQSLSVIWPRRLPRTTRQNVACCQHDTIASEVTTHRRIQMSNYYNHHTLCCSGDPHAHLHVIVTGFQGFSSYSHWLGMLDVAPFVSLRSLCTVCKCM